MCTLMIRPVIYPSNTASVVFSTGPIPARFWPLSAIVSIPIYVNDDNAGESVGEMQIGSNGYITILSSTVSGNKVYPGSFKGTDVSGAGSGWAYTLSASYLIA